jgi:hypothetical protein
MVSKPSCEPAAEPVRPPVLRRAPRAFSMAGTLAVIAGSLVLAGLSGCEIVFPASCPDLDVVCPDVRCDDYKQNREGCSVCECEGDDDGAPTVCWDEADCARGERCDAVTFCERAPGCVAGEPCPEACYGRCVSGPLSCFDSAECPEGQLCAFFDNAQGRETEAPGGGLVAPSWGVCIDASCPAAIALPPCPPGSELIFDPAIDPCVPVCIAVDPCRSLLPEQCALTPGCLVVEEPCACQPGAPCACASLSRCTSIDDCARLSIDECELHRGCVLKPVAHSTPGGLAPCAPGSPDCDAVEPVELVCVARLSDGGCFSDIDCLAGEICRLSTVCGSGCRVDESGGQQCFSECWSERGTCAPSGASCFDLDPLACSRDPRCELVEGGAAPCGCDPSSPSCDCFVPTSACRPRDTTCIVDGDCLPGHHCALVESCLPCDPSSATDLNCAAPCFIEGRCVDGDPPPTTCTADADCGAGSLCLAVRICEVCEGAIGTEEGFAPQPCDPACREGRVCTRPTSPGGLCQEDAHCGAGERCATELRICAENPERPDTGCWTLCVPGEPANDGAYCLDPSECSADERCVFHADVCLDDPGDDSGVCSGWCAGACAEVLTPAHDPRTGTCVTFNDACIPPGWVAGC